MEKILMRIAVSQHLQLYNLQHLVQQKLSLASLPPLSDHQTEQAVRDFYLRYIPDATDSDIQELLHLIRKSKDS